MANLPSLPCNALPLPPSNFDWITLSFSSCTLFCGESCYASTRGVHHGTHLLGSLWWPRGRMATSSCTSPFIPNLIGTLVPFQLEHEFPFKPENPSVRTPFSSTWLVTIHRRGGGIGARRHRSTCDAAFRSWKRVAKLERSERIETTDQDSIGSNSWNEGRQVRQLGSNACTHADARLEESAIARGETGQPAQNEQERPNACFVQLRTHES